MQPSAPAATVHLVFPSRNGSTPLPASIAGTGLIARFANPSDPIETTVVAEGDRLIIRKPLSAPSSGQVIILAAGKAILAATYETSADLVDVDVDVQDATFAFRLEPAETAGVVGNRSIRVSPGSSLKLVFPEGNVVVGEVPVGTDGVIGNLPGLVTGGPASLTIDARPMQLSLGQTSLPLRLAPYETDFKSGSRLIRVLPGIPTSLILGDNSLTIPNIQIAPDGSVAQPQGLVVSQKGVIEPLARPLLIDVGAYTGTWRLLRYETAFGTGNRTISVLKGDRSLAFNVGAFDNVSPIIDPEQSGSQGPMEVIGSRIRFNLIPVTVDPADLKVPLQIQPFESSFAQDRRTLQLPRMPLKGAVALAASSNQIGSFSLDDAGTLATTAPSLSIQNGELRPRVWSVRVTPSSNQAYRVAPFETEFTAGTRTVVMVRGTRGAIETSVTSLPFAIDGDGTVTGADSRIQANGSAISVNLGP